MICEAYDQDGTRCFYLSEHTVQINWTHQDDQAAIQSRLCIQHYRSFKAAMTTHPTLTTIESDPS